MFFTKKKAEEIKKEYIVDYNVDQPTKIYEINDDEKAFIDALEDVGQKLPGKLGFKYVRMSDGTLNISYGSFPVGKVKLQGRKHTMMYMKTLYDTVTIEGEVSDFIANIDKWVSYIKKL